MTVIPELHPILETWLLEGPLSAQIPAYVNRLERGRYAAQSRQRCLSAVAHFAHWMSMCSMPARMIDEGCVEQFLRCHLPRCDCPRCAPRTPSDAHGAMVPMLEILRVEGVIARPPAPSGPIADELRRYDAHMLDACGLAAGTRRGLLDDRTAAVDFDHYSEELFKSLSRSIEAVRAADNWRSTDAVRLIFHVFKQMAEQEADAVDKLVQKLGLTQVKYAFLHVVEQHPFALFDEGNSGTKVWGGGFKGVYAPERGLAVRLGGAESLLCFTGGRDLKQASDGMPLPSLLRLHYRSTFRDMTYLTRQAFDFANHTWRMFTPAPLPITIHYSEPIARLLTGLRHVPEWDPDTMLSPISRTRWFL